MTRSSAPPTDADAEHRVLVFDIEPAWGSLTWIHARHLESGRRIQYLMCGHEPHLYCEPGAEAVSHDAVTDVEHGHESVDGDPLVKLTLTHPGRTNKIRDELCENPHEADTPYILRTAVDTEAWGICRIKGERIKAGVYKTKPDWVEQETRQIDETLDEVHLDIEGGNTIKVDSAPDPIYCIGILDPRYDRRLMFSYHPTEEHEIEEYETLDGDTREVDEHLHYTDTRQEDGERAMLRAFIGWLESRKPEAIATYYGNSFDIPYIINRARTLGISDQRWWGGHGDLNAEYANIPGVQCLDLYEIHDTATYGGLEQGDDLETVLEVFTGIEKEDHGAETKEMWENDPQALFEYNFQDVEATYKIDQVQRYSLFASSAMFLTYTMSITDITKASDLYYGLFLEEAKQRGVALPQRFGGDDWETGGGVVFDPEPGLHEKAVSCDFSSLYPTAITTGNISYETFVPADEVDGDEDWLFEVPDVDNDKLLDPPLYFDTREKGILPTVVDKVWDLKREAGKMLDEAESEKDRERKEIIYDGRKIILNCFTKDTDVITPDGIKNIRELEVGDDVYSLNPDTLQVEVKQVTETHEQPYSGEMAHIQNGRSDFIVTPYHRFPTYIQGEGPGETKLREVQDFPGSQLQIPYGEACQGERIEEFSFDEPIGLKDEERQVLETIESIGPCTRGDVIEQLPLKRSTVERRVRKLMGFDLVEQADSQEHGKAKNSLIERTDVGLSDADFVARLGASGYRREGKQPRTYDMDDWLRLMAWFVTEGNSHRSKRKEYGDGSVRGVSSKTTIFQDTPEHRREIRNLLERMGITFSEREDSFSFCSSVLAEWLKENCGDGSYEKTFPRWVLKLSEDQRRIFFETLMDGDGDARDSPMRFTTASVKLLNRFVALAASLGYKFLVRRDSGAFRVLLSKNKGTITRRKDVEWVENPRDKVYCVTVEDNHTLLAGRNGIFQFTGNSAYGVSNSDKSPLGRVEVGVATTSISRFANKVASKTIKDSGREVLYGDTDSVIAAPNPDDEMEDIYSLFDEAEGRVQDEMHQRGAIEVDRYELEWESVYDPLFLPSAEGDESIKKKYAMRVTWQDGEMLDKPKRKVKGFWMVRRECSEFTREVMGNAFDILLMEREGPMAMHEYIRDVYAKVQERKVQKERVAKRKPLSKDPLAYKKRDDGTPHYWVAAAAHECNQFFDLDGEDKWRAGDRPYGYALEDSPPGYDGNYLLLRHGEEIPDGFSVDWTKHAHLMTGSKMKRVYQGLGIDHLREQLGKGGLQDAGIELPEARSRRAVRDDVGEDTVTTQQSVADFL